jgi:hypothetical protein
MKFSELLGDDQPTEVPAARPADVPALADEVPTPPVAPEPVEAFDASLDSQLDALPGPETAEVAPEPTPVRFGEPEPYQPQPYEPEQYEPAAATPAYQPDAYQPDAYQPEPVAAFEPAVEPAVEPAYEPVAELEPFAPVDAAPLEAPAVEPVAPVSRPTPISVFGGGQVEAQSSGLASLNVAEVPDAEADDDAMRIARLDLIDDDILPTTRKRGKK